MIWSGTSRGRASVFGLGLSFLVGVLALIIGLITPANAQDDLFGPDLGPEEEAPDGGSPSEPPDSEPLPPESPDGGVAPAPQPAEEPAVDEAAPPESVAVEAMPAGPVTAEPAAESGKDVETMVVTAQFREQNPQETPLAITAVDAKTLEERGEEDVSQVANQTPNVRLSPGSASYGPALQAHIRGVGQHDFSFALEPGVGVYVDDVYYSTLTGSIIDLLDLERVEILRGPQGTLAGQNSIGGAIKIYSKPPTGEGGGFVQSTYGRFNRTELRGGGDFTIVDQKLFGRVSGVGKQKDGYVTRYDYACTHPGSGFPSFQTSDQCKLGTEGGKSFAAGRLSLRWLPIEEVEVNVIGDYTNDNSEATPKTLLYVGYTGPMPMDDGQPQQIDRTTTPPTPLGIVPENWTYGNMSVGTSAGSPFISYSPYGNYAQDNFSHSPYINYSTYTNPDPVNQAAPYSIPPDYAVDSGGVSGKIDIDFTKNFSLTSISAYRGYDGAWSADDGTPIGRYMMRNRVEHGQFTQELRLNANFYDTVNATVGGFLLRKDSFYGGRFDLPVPLSFVEASEIGGSSYAGFGNVDWEVIKGLDLIGGARYTWQEKTFMYGRENIEGIALPDSLLKIAGDKVTYDGDHVDFRGAVQYRWIPQLMTYAQVSTGFKGGGVNPRPYEKDQETRHNPETLIAYELGAKTDWLDRRIRLNVAGFWNVYDDILMSIKNCPMSSAPIPCFMPINAGDAWIRGGELEAAVYPVRELGIEGTLAYVNFEYQSISETGELSDITKDMDGPYVPEWQASFGVKYDLLLGQAGTFTPRIDLTWQDSFYTDPVNTEYGLVEDRLLLNGRITWTSFDDTWQTAFEMTNITDLLYYYGIRDDRNSSGMVWGNPAPPFEWAVTVRRNFDI